MSNRERLARIQEAMADSDMLPEQARTHLMTLTGLLGSFTNEARVAEMAFKHVLHQCYQTEETANRAKIAAEATPQYAAFRESKDTREQCLEAIRSCKTFLRSLDEEMRLAR